MKSQKPWGMWTFIGLVFLGMAACGYFTFAYLTFQERQAQQISCIVAKTKIEKYTSENGTVSFNLKVKAWADVDGQRLWAEDATYRNSQQASSMFAKQRSMPPGSEMSCFYKTQSQHLFLRRSPKFRVVWLVVWGIHVLFLMWLVLLAIFAPFRRRGNENLPLSTIAEELRTERFSRPTGLFSVKREPGKPILLTCHSAGNPGRIAGWSFCVALWFGILSVGIELLWTSYWGIPSHTSVSGLGFVILLISIVSFVGLGLYGNWLLFKMVFTRLHLSLGEETLTLRYTFLLSRSEQSIPKKKIRSVQQHLTGGEEYDDDSLPSWGLMVHTHEAIELMEKESHRDTEWLGEVLSMWLGKRFSRSPSQEK